MMAPWAKLPCGDGPQVNAAAAKYFCLLRLPIAHAEVVRDYASAGLQVVEQFRAQTKVRIGQKVERDYRGAVDVGVEEGVQLELHNRVGAPFLSVGARFADRRHTADERRGFERSQDRPG